MSVTPDFVPGGEEGVSQRATLAVKRVPVFMKEAGKRHSDVTSGGRPPAVARHSAECQGGGVAPSFESMSEETVHQLVGHVTRGGPQRVAVDTVDDNKIWRQTTTIMKTAVTEFTVSFEFSLYTQKSFIKELL